MGPVCPICMVVQNERVRYAFWFFAEAANEPETIGALRASRCFCAEHTRLVLADERSAKVLPRLVLECLVAVGADFESAFTTAPSPCPACASEALVARRALKALRDGLDAQTGRSATPTDPLCPKHLRALLLSADRRSALRLARRGGSHFRSTDRVQTVLRLAIGADPDRLYRADMRKQIDPDFLNQPRSPGVLERLLSDLKVCSCLACLAGTRAEFRYLEWMRAQDDERVLAEEVAPLCPPHLNDVALIAPSVAAVVAEAIANHVTAELDTVAARLAVLPSRSPLSRLRWIRRLQRESVGRSPIGVDLALGSERLVGGLMRSERDLFRQATDPVSHARGCSACSVRDDAEMGEVNLVLAATRSSIVALRYGESHGLCLRHVLGVPEACQEKFIRDEMTARIGLLVWQLREVERQRRWSARHELAEDVRSVLSAALALLNDRTFLGAPPPCR
jgi:hypothetical protein